MSRNRLRPIFSQMFCGALLFAFTAIIFQEVKVSSRQGKIHFERKERPATELLTYEKEDLGQNENDSGNDHCEAIPAETWLGVLPQLYLTGPHHPLIHRSTFQTSLYLQHRNIRI